MLGKKIRNCVIESTEWICCGFAQETLNAGASFMLSAQPIVDFYFAASLIQHKISSSIFQTQIASDDDHVDRPPGRQLRCRLDKGGNKKLREFQTDSEIISMVG
jgi:hypothetical protein